MRIEAGRYKGRRLPEATTARPVGGRLRRSLFSVLAPVLDGARVLDLFAGIGALGLEALSRGAAAVVLVERDAAAASALEAWLHEVGADSEARVLRADALARVLPPGPFDLVFVDPPFPFWADEEAVRRLLAGAVGALAEGGWVVLKVPARVALPEDPDWRELRRRAQGSTAWVLLEPTGGGDDGGKSSSLSPGAPMEG